MSNDAVFAPASPKQEMMFKAFLESQITVIGGAAGSGKSYLLQLMPLCLVDDPKSKCIMFRRTTPQITGQGGIWDTAKGIFNELPISQRPKIREIKLEAIFPNGASVKYQHMERVADKLNIQGLQYTMIGVDEACQFEWEQLEYMMSRLRSESRHASRMVMSCNPDPDHELRKIVDWYLDEDGYPIPERDGVIRYFVRRDGDFIWGDTREELDEMYGKGKALSFTFVSANIYDNPPMMESNPEYVSFLEGLNEVDKAQLLHGCWDARAKGANYFERDWLVHSDSYPCNSIMARGYDLAATERSQVEKSPDATVSIKMAKDRDGYFYLIGDYENDFVDPVLQVKGRVCNRVGERDNKIEKQAELDGDKTYIVLPIDPGAAGKQVYNEMAKKFGSLGFRVKKDPVPSNKSKITRFLPFADAAENGLIRIVKNSFDKTTYDYIMKELERFDGERSTSTKKDDFVDAIATTFNFLSNTKSHKPTRLPTYSKGKTGLSQMRNTMGNTKIPTFKAR